MTRLRKDISYILPLCILGLLFSIVVSVFAATYTNQYIGSIVCELNSSSLTEKLTLNLYNDPELLSPNLAVRIYTGGSYGFPRGLVAAALSAQAQRTKVDITTEYLNATPEDFDRVVGMSMPQGETPDDIAGMFGILKLSDIDRSISDISGELSVQFTNLGYITTEENNNINTTVISINNVATSQIPTLNNIYSQASDIYTKANSVYSLVIGQNPSITTLSSKLDSVYSITNSAYSAISGFYDNVTNDWYYLTSESGLINNKLNQKDGLLNSIWSVVNK